MVIKFLSSYEKSKDKLINNSSLSDDIINLTEKLFKENHLDTRLQLKKIVCKKDKNRKSIRVLNTQYRILLSLQNDLAIFNNIMNHTKYNRLNKDC